MRIITRTIVITALAAMPVVANASIAALTENFNYASQADMNNVWKTAGGSGIALVTSGSASPDLPYAKLGNSLVYRDLTTSVTTDWTLSCKVIHDHNQRGTFIGLFDATGKQGYVVWWDSANEAVKGGGFISIRKYDLAAPLTDWNNTGTTKLTSDLSTGHIYDELPMANITLTWTAATGQLTVSVDGVAKGSVTDNSFSSFGRVYLRGNGYQAYDDIIVTAADPVPEAAGLSLLGLGTLALLSRSRKN